MNSVTELFLQNLSSGQIYILEEEFIIGRSKTAHISINDEKISGQHLSVSRSESLIYIKDLDTRNGTSLNNSVVIPGQMIQVKAGDTISIGNIELKLVTSKETEVPPTRKVSEFDAYTGEDNLEMDCSLSKLKDSSPQSIAANLKAPSAQLKDELLEYEKLNRSIEEINDKINYKSIVQEKLIEFEQKNKNLNIEMSSLKAHYDKHKADWEKLNSQISSIEIELRRLKLKKEEFSDTMSKYEEYQKLNMERSRLSLELKTLKRENLEPSKVEKIQRSQEKEKLIKKLELKIRNQEKDKEREKSREQERIKNEIRKLQSKLE
jgi:pSer/pThr/pTyr-binding forkhead associated (FHA) protein